jgi:hypothetical protein
VIVNYQIIPFFYHESLFFDYALFALHLAVVFVAVYSVDAVACAAASMHRQLKHVV